jgi:hypothetical protein
MTGIDILLYLINIDYQGSTISRGEQQISTSISLKGRYFLASHLFFDLFPRDMGEISINMQ